MNQWTADNPTLARHTTIGRSLMGRDLHLYIITANQTSAAPKPRTLLTALIHAREPAGLTVVMYFFERIIADYNNKVAEAVYLLENREIWIVPFVNPDGYIDNESNGVMRRKNMRQTCASQV